MIVAATIVHIMGSAQPSGQPPEVVCERTFVFALVDEPSGVPVFVGMVTDPTG